MKLVIYDPPLCCSSGLCGPTLDPVLVALNDALLALKKQGVVVERYNLAQQPAAFIEQPQVAALLQEKGNEALPIILINGTVWQSGRYPAYEEFCAALGLEPLKRGKPFTIA